MFGVTGLKEWKNNYLKLLLRTSMEDSTTPLERSVQRT